MTRAHAAALAAPLWLCLNFSLVAQEPETQDAHDEMGPLPVTLLPHDELLGSKVVAARHDGAAPDASAAAVASIVDLALDSRTGQALTATLLTADSDARRVVLPWASLRFDAHHKRFELGNDVELDRLPMAEEHDEVDEGDADAATRPGPLRVAELRRWLVRAEDAEVGMPAALVFEPSTGRTAFVAVSAASLSVDGKLVLPWAALRISGTQLSVARPAADLAEAPLLLGKRELQDADFRAEVYAFYGVATPAYERPMSAQPSRR